ncbi:hypothetical protein HJFPF1_04679 [Paramyrothecium foliicola]|nr:hypothetical protein HJFPF1_04679 [Paramyrothecium foliicola]
MARPGNAVEALPVFSEAIQAERLDSNTYKVNLRQDYCISSVPNGGYTASCMLSAAKAYLVSRNLPGDVLVAHFEYPSRTSVGPAVVTIEDVKLGSQLSMLHLTLWQGGLLSQSPWITPSVSKRTLLAYTRHANLRNFGTISVPTPVESRPPQPDFNALKATGMDDNWAQAKVPKAAGFARTLRNWQFYLPRHESFAPGVLDLWMRFSSGERITQTALTFIVDSFPYKLHQFLITPGVYLWEKMAGAEKGQLSEQEEDALRANIWFPTLSLNLEAKMALPEDGVEWLAMRVRSKQMKDGRFDIEALVRDVDGNYVALGHQVAMILSMDRNTRRLPETKSAL